MNLNILLQQAADNSALMGLFIILIAAFFYFIPTIVGRNKRNITAIFFLNFLLGWTILGWVGALIWALSSDGQPMVINNYSQAPTTPWKTTLTKTNEDQLQEFKELVDKGLITQEDFEAKKKQLLGI